MSDTKPKSPIGLIFFTIFIDLLGFGILIPVIPELLADPASPFYLLPIGASVSHGYILLGLLIAIFPIGQFIATPILGQLSDFYGRRKVLAFSIAGTSLSYIVFAIGVITHNIPLLFAARFFDGLTGGNIAVAQAAIADVTPPEKRAKNFGLIGAAFGLGFIVGPFIGGKLSDPSVISWFNAATPFWFAALLAGANAISVIIRFPETNKYLIHGKVTWNRSIQNIKKAFSMKGVNVLFLTNFFFYAGFTFFTTFFSVFLIKKFGFSQGNIGDFFAYLGLWTAFTQVVITRRMNKRFSEDKIVRITLVAAGACLFLYFLPNMPWQLLFVVPFVSIPAGLSMANLTALLSRSVEPSIQGEILGINASVQALAQAIPPIISGFVAATLTPSTPIIIGGIVIMVGGIIFNFFFKPKLTAASVD